MYFQRYQRIEKPANFSGQFHFFLRFRRILAVVLVCLIVGSPAAAAAKQDRPHLVLIIADDLAWDDCGAYGHPTIQTPHLDKLAQTGMRFDEAYLTCSSCSPSRSSIITGRYPHATGGAFQLHNELPADQLTFVDMLNEAGYDTAIAGKIHPRQSVADRFSRVYGVGKPDTGGCGEWVRALQQRNYDKPLFAWLASLDPHRDYQPRAIEKPHRPEEVIVPPYLPDVPEIRTDLALYYDEISRLDSNVGAVIDELERQQIREQTLIIFLSDNGRPFPRCKTTIYGSGIHTPLIANWPGHILPNSVCKNLVSSVDLAPTFCHLAGLQSSPTFQGVNLASLFKSPAAAVREQIFAEHNWHDYDDHQRSCRNLKFNYIRTTYTDLPGIPPADAVKSITFQTMLKMKADGKLEQNQLYSFETPRAAEELYDVVNDPHELNNLALHPDFAETIQQMRTELDRWVAATEDFIPAVRRPDEFDRITGQRLPGVKKWVPQPAKLP